MSRTTTVTHPDGTVSKRKSANALYAFAVEVTTDQRKVAANQRQEAEEARLNAARARAAADLGKIVEETRPWMRDMTRLTYYLMAPGGEKVYAGAATVYADGTIHRDTKNNGEEGDSPVEYVRNSAERYDAMAVHYDEMAVALDAGPALAYGVVRWSRTQVLAEKGANEFRHYAQVRIVAVDAV
jgi:hypothetical protein